MFNDLRVFFAYVAIAFAGMAGLFLSAHGETETAYNLGLGVFFAALVLGVVLTRRVLDSADGHE